MGMRAATGLVIIAACGMFASVDHAWAEPNGQVSNGDIQKALDSCPTGKVAGPDAVCVRAKSGRMGFDPAAPSDSEGEAAPIANGTRSVKTAVPQRAGAQETVNLQLNFSVGSADLSDQDKANARALAAMLTLPKYAPVKVQIAGYTDKTGGAAFNMDLSKRRAEAVKAFVVSLGVEADRIETVGYGYTKLVKRVVIASRVE
jgi:outer membrane protein OmpA-like peptidoglycan-associated protein